MPRSSNGGDGGLTFAPLGLEGFSGGGAAVLEAGALSVTDDGFEQLERVCAQELCETGGLLP